MAAGGLTTAALGRGAGKVIVFGEHAVVYGVPALAAGLAQGCIVEVRKHDGRSQVKLDGKELDFDDPHPVAQAFHIALQVTNMPTQGLHATPHFHLPVGAGLGSSAAFAVALCRALFTYARKPLLPDALAEYAHSIEGSFHGQPSGLDAYLAQYGGVGRFIKGQGFEKLQLPAIEVCIADSGLTRQTTALVAQVAQRHQHLPMVTKPIFEGIAQVVEQGIAAWQRSDWKTLGECMDINQGLLDALSVSHAKNARLVETARAAGALGAKLTGAGGGGCVIALCGSRGPEIEAALRLHATSVFRVTLGGTT